MIFSVVLAVLQMSTADFLVVDGFAIGMRTEKGWTKASPQPKPFSLGMNRVNIGSVQDGATTVQFGPNESGTGLIVQNEIPEGVYYSGKVWQPVAAGNCLERSSAMSWATRFAKDNGVTNPRPYLLHVWEIAQSEPGTYLSLISAASRPPIRNANLDFNKDWEAVLLQWRTPTSERVFNLNSSFPKAGQAIAQCRLRAVGDFDGDGNIEFVTTSKLPSLLTVTLWTFRGEKLTPILDFSYEVS